MSVILLVPAVSALLIGACIFRARRRTKGDKLTVGFILPDLGIGEIERLAVHAAAALQNRGYLVRLYAARPGRSHRFPETIEQLSVEFYGDWLPRSICGRQHAILACLQSMYVAAVMALRGPPFDVIICYRVSACIPILRLTRAWVLFNCHFPDAKLPGGRRPALKQPCQTRLEAVLEELTTGMAHKVLVNSRFMQKVYVDTFRIRNQPEPEVLYPCVTLRDTADPAKDEFDEACSALPDWTFVSIGCFERTSNADLALDAFAMIRDLDVKESNKPRLVFAGGFDPNSRENLEQLQQLAGHVIGAGLKYRLLLPSALEPYVPRLVEESKAGDHAAEVWIVLSPTDRQRAALVAKSLGVLYTPADEQLGLAAVEAMGAGRPVIVCDSGGPSETVVHGRTGFVCRPVRMRWAEAMLLLMEMDEAERSRTREEARARAGEFGADLDRLLRELVSGGPCRHKKHG